jgi:hypothetical protein
MPFKVANSVRPLDPTMPVGMTNAMFWTSLPAGAVMPNFPFTNPTPGTANGTTVNNVTDFGWEYVWHCHLLGHEENDMMRAISFQVAPAAATQLRAQNQASKVSLSWTNNETIQTNFTFYFQRATDANFTQNLATFSVSSGPRDLPTYAITSSLPGRGTYYYRVRAQNALGYSAWSNVGSVRW